MCNPAIQCPWAEGVPPSTPPEPLEIKIEWPTESNASSTHVGQGKLQYLIDWEDCGPDERCWIPAHDVLDLLMVYEFHYQHPEKTKPHPRGQPRKNSVCRVSSSRGVTSCQCQIQHLTPFPRVHLWLQTWLPWTPAPSLPAQVHLITDYTLLDSITTTLRKHTHSTDTLQSILSALITQLMYKAFISCLLNLDHHFFFLISWS